MKIIELHASVTASNDRDAEILRSRLKERGTLLINLMSSPGSGKTSLLEATLKQLRDELKIAVMEADIDSAVDAERIASAGGDSVQVHTDGMCHMDAGMTAEGLRGLNPKADLVFLENVGNLICPAEFDTGAGKNVMILSVPEGDDKPLKYPLMFQKSDVLVISKTDALPYFDFDLKKCEKYARELNPEIVIFPLSARTGEGMDGWISWLKESLKEWRMK